MSPINLLHDLLCQADRIGDGAEGRRNPLSAVVQASFRAAKIDAAMSRRQVASAFGARPLLHCNRGVLCQCRRGLAPAMPPQGGPKGLFVTSVPPEPPEPT